MILLPDCLDDYVVEDNPVRVIDVFIDELDLAALGFEGMLPTTMGLWPFSLGIYITILASET
jgi:hypothetical protein